MRLEKLKVRNGKLNTLVAVHVIYKSCHFFCVLVLALILNGCVKSEKQEITVDVQIVNGFNGEFKTIYNDTQSLDYYLDGKLLGRDESGAKILLLSLKEMKGPRSVKINAPPRIVAGTGKAVVLETNSLDPYIKDQATSNAITTELNRINRR